MFKNIALFCDVYGSQLLQFLPDDLIKCIVVASNRADNIDILKKEARNLGCEFLIQPSVKSEKYNEFYEHFKELNIDLIICYSYSLLIQKDILELVNFNAINIHASLLPKNRGPNPTQWALINGENFTGTSIHYMENGFDTGDIVAQKKIRINNQDTWKTIDDRLNILSIKLFRENVDQILNGSNSRIKQKNEQMTQTKRLTPEFPKINFDTMNVLKIYNLIRAQVQPLKGAFVELSNKRKYFKKLQSFHDIYKMRFDYTLRMYSTENIELCSLSSKDVDLLYKWINDKDIVHFNNTYVPIDYESHIKWFKSALKSTDMIIFGIKNRKNQELIGTCYLSSIDLISKKAELQIRIADPDNRGKGYGYDVLNLLLEFAWKDLNLNKVYLHVFDFNEGAISLYEKVGFKKEGILKKHVFIDGEYRDLIIMSIFSEEVLEEKNGQNSR